MDTSTLIPIPVTNNTNRARDSTKRRKRKKIQKQSDSNSRDQLIQNSNNNDDSQIKQWKSEAQQRVYSSKLLQALRHDSAVTAPNNKARSVRETADRVLAVTAKGRSRWIRAILTNKLKLKFMRINRKQRGLVTMATGNSRLKKKPGLRLLKLKRKNLPAVQKKTRVLGGLVPGCRKQSLPVVLEEASNYIPALEMQVKAMTALVKLLSQSGHMSSITTSNPDDSSQVDFARAPPFL